LSARKKKPLQKKKERAKAKRVKEK